jgi:hypothetical protein
VITLAAHVAPFTATKRDDFLTGKKNILWTALKKAGNLVAGNYGKAKNQTGVVIADKPKKVKKAK